MPEALAVSHEVREARQEREAVVEDEAGARDAPDLERVTRATRPTSASQGSSPDRCRADRHRDPRPGGPQ